MECYKFGRIKSITTREINVTFPEEYHAENLAGKPAMFKVKLISIKEKILPELDDEFAKDVSEFETLDEYKKDLEKKIKEEKEASAKNAKAIVNEIGVAYTVKSTIPKVAKMFIPTEIATPASINKDCLEKNPEFLIIYLNKYTKPIPMQI